MLSRIIHSRSRSIISAAFLLAIMALMSRVLGLLRDRILAGKFGAGDELDIYFAAFRVPDLLYNIVIAGAISSAFVPVFISLYTKNKKEAWRVASNFLNISIFSLLILGGIFIVLAPFIMRFITPGFSEEKMDVTITIARIMFLSPLFLGISAIMGGILHSFRRFLTYATGPIFYNFGIIFGALVLTNFWGVYGLAWGVACGAFLHFIVQIPSVIFSGFSWEPIFTLKDKYFRKIFFLMLPRAFGLAIFQLNLWVITAVASMLQVGSVSVFNLANNLQFLPIGIIGYSFATAAFPSFSKSASRKELSKLVRQLERAIGLVLFFVLPLSIFMFVLRAHIVRILLGTGEFGWIDTRLTAAVLGIFAIGIFAHSMIPLLSKVFYALQNTKTPVFINSIGFLVNMLLSIALVFWLFEDQSIINFIRQVLDLEDVENIQILGLPLAFSLAGVINFQILIWALNKRLMEFSVSKLFLSGLKIFFASIVAGFACYSVLAPLATLVDTHTVFGLVVQAGASFTVGVFVYLGLVVLLKSKELFYLFKILKGKFL